MYSWSSSSFSSQNPYIGFDREDYFTGTVQQFLNNWMYSWSFPVFIPYSHIYFSMEEYFTGTVNHFFNNYMYSWSSSSFSSPILIYALLWKNVLQVLLSNFSIIRSILLVLQVFNSLFFYRLWYRRLLYR